MLFEPLQAKQLPVPYIRTRWSTEWKERYCSGGGNFYNTFSAWTAISAAAACNLIQNVPIKMEFEFRTRRTPASCGRQLRTCMAHRQTLSLPKQDQLRAYVCDSLCTPGIAPPVPSSVRNAPWRWPPHPTTTIATTTFAGSYHS